MADGASLRLERWAALNCHPLHRCDHHCDPLGVIIIIVCLFVYLVQLFHCNALYMFM